MPEEVTLIAACDETRPHVQRLLGTYSRAGFACQYIGWDRRRQFPALQNHSRYLMRGWGFGNALLLFGIPLWVMRLAWYLRRRRQGIVHALDLDCAAAVALARSVGRLRYDLFIYDVRDNYALRHNWGGFARGVIEAIDSYVLRCADIIIVVDESRIDSVFQAYQDKILILYNCPFEGCRPQPRQAQDGELVVFAGGHLGEARGIGVLLDVVESVSGVRVVMAGRFVERSLEARVRSSSRVDFRGWISPGEAMALCARCDAVFSYYDPATEINRRAASNKWYDAMASGKPIITNSESAKAQWIVDRDLGYACAYADRDGLRKLLLRIRDHPEEAREKGAKGRLLFESTYNWPAMEKQLLSRLRCLKATSLCA